MNKDREEYIRHIIKKGYRQIGDDVFELMGMRFYLHEDTAIRLGREYNTFYLRTVGYTYENKVCLECPKRYVVESDLDMGEPEYACSITGRYIGTMEFVSKEHCDCE